MVDPKSGEHRAIPCDKEKVGSVIWKMLQKRREYELGSEAILPFRLWTAFSSGIMQGLFCNEMASIPTSVEQYLAEYRFESPIDEQNCGSGFTPLHLACLSGNTAVVRDLINNSGVDVNAHTIIQYGSLGSPKGCTPLHLTSYCPLAETHAIVTALLSAGADPNATTGAGFSVLMGAAIFQNEVLVESVLTSCTVDKPVRLEQTVSVNASSVLGIAAFGGTTRMVELLLSAGADRGHRNDNGSHLISDACQNPVAGPSMLELIMAPPENCTRSAIDINYQAKPRTLKWALINKIFRTIVRSKMSRSDLAMGLAHAEGSTVSSRVITL